MLNGEALVAQLCPVGSQFSGYGTQTSTWVTKLKEMGHEMTLSTYWGLQGAPTLWNDVTLLPGWGPNYCSPSLYGHWQVLRPELVLTLGDIWVMDANLLREMPVAHWLPVDTRPQSLADRNCLDASGAELIAMSRFGYDRMRTAGYNPVYVPHGIDTELFKPGDRDELRAGMELEDRFVIGVNAANNDAIRKAIPEMMLAFARFNHKHPEANAVLALHTGVHQEGGQDLEAVAENLGIVDLVRVVDQYRYSCGLVQPSDLAEWYALTDVLLATTYAEGFGLPIMEAQSCGTPVITTDSSSMVELNPFGLAVHGEPFWNGVHKGWWMRPSLSGMEAAMEQSWENPPDAGTREKLRDWARTYDVEVVAREYMAPAVDELTERMKKKGRV